MRGLFILSLLTPVLINFIYLANWVSVSAQVRMVCSLRTKRSIILIGNSWLWPQACSEIDWGWESMVSSNTASDSLQVPADNVGLVLLGWENGWARKPHLRHMENTEFQGIFPCPATDTSKKINEWHLRKRRGTIFIEFHWRSSRFIRQSCDVANIEVCYRCANITPNVFRYESNTANTSISAFYAIRLWNIVTCEGWL
jgi:hypothetical protein